MKILAKCNNCHQDINIAEQMCERRIDEAHSKDGIVLSSDDELILTILVCPHCGSESVVQIDNEETLTLFQKQINLSRRMGKTQFLAGGATQAQKKKQSELTATLMKVRQELVDKYDHTLYQYEGKEYQLDIYTPSVIVGGKENGRTESSYTN